MTVGLAGEKEIVVTAGQVSIQCVVEGENTGQNIYCFLGEKNSYKTGNTCTGPSNGYSLCLEFDLFLAAETGRTSSAL